MNILGVEEIQAMLGISRKAVIHMLNTSSCPVLPRRKGQTFRVPEQAFREWLQKGEY